MDRSYATAGELLGALTLGALLLLIGLAIGGWMQWGGRGAVQGGGQGGGTGVAYATISLTCGSQTSAPATARAIVRMAIRPQLPCAPTVRVMKPGLHATEAARRHRGQVAALRRDNEFICCVP